MEGRIELESRSRSHRKRKGRFELLNRGKVFLKNLGIDHIVRIVRQKKGRLTQEDNGQRIPSSAEAECDPKSLNGSMSIQWVLLKSQPRYLGTWPPKETASVKCEKTIAAIDHIGKDNQAAEADPRVDVFS